jgi:glycerophosphoryl diester phosphodiesterase
MGAPGGEPAAEPEPPDPAPPGCVTRRTADGHPWLIVASALLGVSVDLHVPDVDRLPATHRDDAAKPDYPDVPARTSGGVRMFRRFGVPVTIILVTLSGTNATPTVSVSRVRAAHVPAEPGSAAPTPAARAPAPVPGPGSARTLSRVVDVGHRGTRAYAPENTITAFREGVARHADLVEFDVQQTKDGKLIIMHDATLARTTDVEHVFPRRSPWRVGDFTLKEIRRLDAGSWFGARYAGERVPTLDETLRALDGTGTGFLLEVKNPARYPGIGRRVGAELRAHAGRLAPGRLIVQSFDWGFIKRFHAELPAVTTALLGTPPAGRLASVRSYADLVNPAQGDVTRTYVARAHALGLRVYPWTVDDPAGMRRLIADGVDGIISNRPDVLRRVIEAQSRQAGRAPEAPGASTGHRAPGTGHRAPT